MFQDLDCSKIPPVEAGGKLSRLLVRKEAVRTADMEPKQSLFCDRAETTCPIADSVSSRLDAVPATNKELVTIPWAQANTEFQVPFSSEPSLTIPLVLPNASAMPQHSGVTHGDLDVDPIELPRVLELPSGNPDPAHDVVDALDTLLERAKDNGVSSSILKELRELVTDFLDIWRISLSGDPPAKLPPLEVQLRPDASPVRVKLRRYPPAQRNFLKQFVDAHIDFGLVYRNLSATWCSAALLVPKPGPAGFRFTVDLRPVNQQTIPFAWPMPHIESELSSVHGSSRFCTFDLSHGYWQLELAAGSRECQSFITPEGVFTPHSCPSWHIKCSPTHASGSTRDPHSFIRTTNRVA
jgi:hypothetical protein